MVITLLHNFQLQAPESFLSLPINHRHVNAKQSEERIRRVFLPRRLPLRSPTHNLCHTELAFCVREQYDMRDSSSDGNFFCQAGFGAEFCPVFIEEDDGERSKEFLQGPVSCEPSALYDFIHGLRVRKISITLYSISIPFKHRVYGLRQLGAIRFVDAACVDPDPLKAIEASLGATIYDFFIP
jgi:hypothetical protein